MRVQRTTAKQPRAEAIKAAAKIIEALDPIYGQRVRVLIAAMYLMDEARIAKKLEELV